MTRAGIIAAGDGTRLQKSHPGQVKPMLAIAGRPLCHWVAGALSSAGVGEITMLLNSRGGAAIPSLKSAFPGLSWNFLEKDTASSWESFRLIARELARKSGSFLISTVDALVDPKDLALFIRAAAESPCEAALGLTDFIDDEKPLWAELEADGKISRLGPSVQKKKWATSGLYFIGAGVAEAMPAAGNYASLREYWIGLAESGVGILGVPLAKTVDVDRPEDLREAEIFIKERTLKSPDNHGGVGW